MSHNPYLPLPIDPIADGNPLRLTESFWQHNPSLNRNVNITRAYVNHVYDKYTIEVAIEHDERKFTCLVDESLALEMRNAWGKNAQPAAAPEPE